MILTVIFLYACSFDNKTGIWRDLAEEEVQSLTKKSKTKIFDKEIKNNNKSVQIDNKKRLSIGKLIIIITQIIFQMLPLMMKKS